MGEDEDLNLTMGTLFKNRDAQGSTVTVLGLADSYDSAKIQYT